MNDSPWFMNSQGCIDEKQSRRKAARCTMTIDPFYLRAPLGPATPVNSTPKLAPAFEVWPSPPFSLISRSFFLQDSQENHIIDLNCNTSSFQTKTWFCALNSLVSLSHLSTFSGLTKSQATLMQSDRLQTWCAHPAGINTASPGRW